MAIRAVIFDIGGVLVRAEGNSSQRALEARLGLEEGAIARAFFTSKVEPLALVGKATEDDVWADVMEQLGIDRSNFPGIKDEFWGDFEVDRELMAFVESLRPHYITAVLSNALPGIREIHERTTHLERSVDVLFFSCELGLAKPDPEAFRSVAAQLGVEPEECIFVDDVPRYLEGARTAGMHAILFESTEQVISDVTRALEE